MDTLDGLSPTYLRIQISKFNLKTCELIDSILIHRDNVLNKEGKTAVLQSLLDDVLAIEDYRSRSDQITIQSILACGIKQTNATDVLQWIDTDRDFIYTTSGLRFLERRYLLKGEAIQIAMLRIAKLLATNPKTNEYCMKLLHLFYDLISCGYVHTSSIFADSDFADSTIIRGEACRLLMADKDYGREFIKQMEKISTMISMGVGVGMGAVSVPLNGSNEKNKVRTGITALARKFEACNLCLSERKAKIAFYTYIHNDTLFEIIDLKRPNKAPLENVFFGLMIPDYFMECVRTDQEWYFFAGDPTLPKGVIHLSELGGANYMRMYKALVGQKLYVSHMPAKAVMRFIIDSLAKNGSPYIIWDDTVNCYSNHRHLGKIRTLNLCAEITNYSSSTNTASCTLLSVNFGMFNEFPEVFQRIKQYVYEEVDNYFDVNLLKKFKYGKSVEYAFVVGYMTTLGLNVFMGPDRERREIGITPCGIYDMAAILDADPIIICSEVTEVLYLGAIQSSCSYSFNHNIQCINYSGSAFHLGVPQWLLRRANLSDTVKFSGKRHWISTMNRMKFGMANSMLTAQAPTATTAMLTNVTESVTLPVAFSTTKESENGRTGVIVYGLMYRILNDLPIAIDNSVSKQLDMYEVSAQFVDHSQATMFTVNVDIKNYGQVLFDLVKETYLRKLKTGIYYVLLRQINPTLNIVQNNKKVKSRSCPSTCDACTL